MPVKIKGLEKGLVIKNNQLADVLSEGWNMIPFISSLVLSDINRQIKPPIPLQVMLRNEKFVAQTNIVDVKETEIALVFENNLFTGVFTAGRYTFWKEATQFSFVLADISGIAPITGISRELLSRKEVAPYVRSFTVEPYEKAVLFVNGEFQSVLEPGTYNFWRNAISVVIARTDMRMQQMEISGQEILSRDKASLRINFFVRFMVSDLIQALVKTREYDKQLYVMMQIALRDFVGALALDELLAGKEAVSKQVFASAAEKAKELGVTLIAVGIRDIILPGEMKEIMNQVLVAEKKAQANTIMRREETASTRSLLNTARLMEENAMLYRLKEMEYVEKIAEKIGTVSLNGGTQIGEQLKQLFAPSK